MSSSSRQLRTIAFAMECVERGWLAEPWLTFGSGEALSALYSGIAAGHDVDASLAALA